MTNQGQTINIAPKESNVLKVSKSVQQKVALNQQTIISVLKSVEKKIEQQVEIIRNEERTLNKLQKQLLGRANDISEDVDKTQDVQPTDELIEDVTEVEDIIEGVPEEVDETRNVQPTDELIEDVTEVEGVTEGVTEEIQYRWVPVEKISQDVIDKITQLNQEVEQRSDSLIKAKEEKVRLEQRSQVLDFIKNRPEILQNISERNTGILLNLESIPHLAETITKEKVSLEKQIAKLHTEINSTKDKVSASEQRELIDVILQPRLEKIDKLIGMMEKSNQHVNEPVNIVPSNDVWERIEKATGVSVSNDEIKAFVSSPEPKFVQIPTGRTLYAAGNDSKRDMKWGAFQELDTDWYQQGNQLAADWYKDREMLNKIVPMFEYSVTLKEPVSAVMGYVGDQMGAPKSLVKPDSKKPLRKFQFFNPTGLGKSVRGRLLGYVVPSRKSRRK